MCLEAKTLGLISNVICALHAWPHALTLSTPIN